eukprot:288040_1
MGIFSRFHRVPPFFVGALCGGAVYVYYHQRLQLKYHALPESIWNIMYTQKNRSSIQASLDDDISSTSSTIELYEIALNKRKNREYYRDSLVIGWNDSVRSVHSFLIRHIFGEELK